MKTVTAAFAKANLPDLLKAIEKGESVTISRYNKPIADLVPSKMATKPAPKFGTLKGKIEQIAPLLGRNDGRGTRRLY